MHAMKGEHITRGADVVWGPGKDAQMEDLKGSQGISPYKEGCGNKKRRTAQRQKDQTQMESPRSVWGRALWGPEGWVPRGEGETGDAVESGPAQTVEVLGGWEVAGLFLRVTLHHHQICAMQGGWASVRGVT